MNSSIWRAVYVPVMFSMSPLRAYSSYEAAFGYLVSEKEGKV
jgi:hypothetical protein